MRESKTGSVSGMYSYLLNYNKTLNPLLIQGIFLFLGMKKILFLLIIAVMSCSSDDDNNTQNMCLDITGLSAECTPDCIYEVTYINANGIERTVEVSENTYNYYSDIVNDNIEDDCWVGANP